MCFIVGDFIKMTNEKRCFASYIPVHIKMNVFRIQYERMQQYIHYIAQILVLVLCIILEISTEVWLDVVFTNDLWIFVGAVCARYHSGVVRENKERYGLSQLVHVCWWRHHAMFLYVEMINKRS